MKKIRKIFKKYKNVGKPTSLFSDNVGNSWLNEVARQLDDVNEKLDEREEGGSSAGRIGRIRVVVDKDTPYLEIKSNKGWIRSSSDSASGFEFKK